MKRTARDKRPNVKPVKKVELSQKNVVLRIIGVVVLIAIAVSAFTYALATFFQGESGWREIEADSSAKTNVSGDFVFQYNIGASGLSSSAENRELITLYTEAAVNAYQLFTVDEEFENLNNMYAINAHPNEILEVDSLLYQSFELIDRYESRYLYLGPVYDYFDNIFNCQDDTQTVDFDPIQNEEIAQFYQEIADYAKDESSISIELLGDNKIRLNISQEYLNYAKENDISKFIDFDWMTNAFLVDYFAEIMIEHNHTFGSISSIDGFTRNLDDSGNSYSYNLYDLEGSTIYPAAVMDYTKATSIVYLHNYEMNSLEAKRFYTFANGRRVTSYLDIADGQDRTALNNLVLYGNNEKCGEMVLQIAPIYLSDTFDAEKLAPLKDAGISSIYCQDHVIYYNDSNLKLKNLYSADVTYTSKLVE